MNDVLVSYFYSPEHARELAKLGVSSSTNGRLGCSMGSKGLTTYV